MNKISSPLLVPQVDTNGQVRAVRSSEAPTKPTSYQFTVKEADLADAKDFFLDAASWTRVRVQQETDQRTVGDYGDGQGTYNTIKFKYLPDRADGTYSQGYLNKIESAKRMFEGRIRSAGIQNYAPVE